MVFPYKPTGKCNFIALKALGMTHKRYLIFSYKIGFHSRWLLYEATLENRYQHLPYFVRPTFHKSRVIEGLIIQPWSPSRDQQVQTT